MLSSISAQAKTIKNHALYSGSKAAVEAFVRCLAQDMGDKKIRFNCIAPGGVKTDMYAEHARNIFQAVRTGAMRRLRRWRASFGSWGGLVSLQTLVGSFLSCAVRMALG
jgi:NAD(P)-dependent dehydrogenase (short-subunit alcohol dehydrogenase family)